MSNSFALQFEDLEPVGPGTPAGRYLRLFWHPIYRAGGLPNSRAKPIEILGEKFTLYRDDAGAAHLVAFRCAHRGSQLSLGWIEGDALRCRYHGWKFDAAGQCIEQPNEPKPFCQRVTIPTYPVKEYAGLIFAYLGEGEPPPFRHFVDLDQPGTIVVDPVEILPCSFWNKMDNDPAHVPWVHRASQQRLGRPEPYTVQEVNHQEAPYGLLGTNRNGGGHKRFIMPNIRQWWPRSRTRGFEGRYLGETKVVFTVPINDSAFCSFDVTHTPFQGDEAKAYIEVHTPRQEEEAETRWELAEKGAGRRAHLGRVAARHQRLYQFLDRGLLHAGRTRADRQARSRTARANRHQDRPDPPALAQRGQRAARRPAVDTMDDPGRALRRRCPG